MTQQMNGIQSPRFRIEDYFSGRTQAWGIFQDRFGKPRRQFQVDIEGIPYDDRFELIEDFLYDDGQTERRVWTITKKGENGYEGCADDVLGTACGIVNGNTLNWRYKFMLSISGRKWKVEFDDWFFQLSDDILLNRARVNKLGIRLGEATIVFSRLSNAQGKEDANEKRGLLTSRRAA